MELLKGLGILLMSVGNCLSRVQGDLSLKIDHLLGFHYMFSRQGKVIHSPNVVHAHSAGRKGAH